MKPKFFGSQSAFRRWLERNHDKSKELIVGFHKKSAGKETLTYPEALDEALCFGWIDGVRKRVDDESYMIRFSPRKPKSIWSLVNLRHVERLIKSGRMAEPGVRAYESREQKRTGIYSFESAPREFSDELLRRFQRNTRGWNFFQGQPPSFRRTAIFWVTSAKKEETQLRRLEQLIKNCEDGIRDPVVTGKSKNSVKSP
jgi:uncharacterized protein YdeI (YjbR/CyaY-like superfamily)